MEVGDVKFPRYVVYAASIFSVEVWRLVNFCLCVYIILFRRVTCEKGDAVGDASSGLAETADISTLTK